MQREQHEPERELRIRHGDALGPAELQSARRYLSARVAILCHRNRTVSMSNRIATIGRYTVLEALRTRLPALTAVAIGLIFIASFFVREISITESVRIQTSFYAATARFAMFFLAALHVIASISREFHEKGLDMVLALDVPRSHYVLGKLAGFLAIATALAAAAGIPLLSLAGWEAAAQWSLSLAFELAIVASLSLFCVIT